ncbi:MAG: dihydroneopterin aldolase [Rubellimicrobium sp.]|nr:dihydroneopterin aldolase [Rubellimicrobium sp.]
MQDETSLAFAHPGERAIATARPGEPLDRISLRDHVREVEIGAFQQERGALQRLRFNIVVEVAPLPPGPDDDVDRILSYDRLTEAIDTELGAERLNLLETLAARVAERILSAPQAVRVFVRIEKLDRGPGDLGVEIVRARDSATTAAPAAAVGLPPPPQPRVCYLGPAAMADPDLPRVIDRLAAGPAPLVLCVGAAGLPVPQSPAPLAQRRIDLLAIEQNAWVLAGRDRRCIVVDSRTELDWAMRHGRISVWAPSRIVLDAVDGPSARPDDALALAVWFAGAMQAAELVVLGSDAPVEAAMPVRRGLP